MDFIYSLLNFRTKSQPKKPDALRCGILGAARIAPAAVIVPSRSHSEIIITAVAARSRKKADAYAKANGIPKVYSGENGYQELLDDPEIDVIYNPLPNGLHYEWTLKALKAGKHVLLEKPATDTEDEAREIFDYADKKKLVVLEAFHSRLHPAIHRVKQIVKSEELGKIKSISASLCVPKQMQIAKDDDIRFNLGLGGGILMDMGCYPLMAIRFIAGTEPVSVISAHAEVLPNTRNEESRRNIDIGTTASLSFPNDVIGSISCHARKAGWGPFGLIPRMPEINLDVECESGKIKLYNYCVPTLYHYISVEPTKGKKRTEKAYTFADGYGKDWWTTYRYQLEAFVDKVKGREPNHWIDGESTIANMRWIEKIYEKSGLRSRPRSQFKLSDDFP